MILKSTDGINIFYSIYGSGIPIILLHGFPNDQNMWNDLGWTRYLEKKWKVILIDIRGCGKSDKPENEKYYSIENHINDIKCILNNENLENPVIWGWSLGASIAFQYSSKNRCRSIIGCGSYFGLIFSKEYTEQQLSKTNDPILRSRINAFNSWPIIEPEDIKCRMFIYSGTNDGNVYKKLEEQKDRILKMNGRYKIYDGVDHWGLVNEKGIIENDISDFLSI
jgi:surfactin synthase thioesterase subunit